MLHSVDTITDPEQIDNIRSIQQARIAATQERNAEMEQAVTEAAASLSSGSMRTVRVGRATVNLYAE